MEHYRSVCTAEDRSRESATERIPCGLGGGESSRMKRGGQTLKQSGRRAGGGVRGASCVARCDSDNAGARTRRASERCQIPYLMKQLQ